MKINRNNIIEKLYIAILLVIFGGVVLHAPISVGFGTLFPDYALLIKSWKEVLMLIAGVIALWLLYRHKPKNMQKDPIIIAVAVYATLHLLFLFYNNQGLVSSLAGLIVDLRYLLYFALVYIALRIFPGYKKVFIYVGIGGAIVVCVFALLQVFILPNDFLKLIGYGKETIAPYLTIDENSDFIRINSTLRGPNPLGAYAGILISLIVAAFSMRKIKKERSQIIVASILSIGGLVALWASYSRSALAGLIVSLTIVLITVFYKKLSTKSWITIGFVCLAMIGGLFLVRDSQFVSNVILHDNPGTGSSVSSNDDHLSSIKNSTAQMIAQPFGAGIGSTGSASLLGDSPLVIENQYLFVAHELGWLGLALFLYIFISILKKLWKIRDDWLALGTFAAGVGLALIGILLPVWVDDTVSIVWWGLAGIVVGSRWYIVDGVGENHGKAKIEQTPKRTS